MQLIVLPGDGIGPEITRATVQVLNCVASALSLDLVLDTHEIGLVPLAREGTTCPAPVLDACRAADGVILGPISHADYPARDRGGINVSAELRIQLDLYANLRPSRSRAGLPHWGRTPMDLVIVRENTEGFYADRNMFSGGGEFMPTPDVALSLRKVTAAGSSRIARAAFDLAVARRSRGGKGSRGSEGGGSTSGSRVTAVHKANVLKVSEALFLREVRAIAAAHPDVTYDEQLVDSMAALLVRDAARFDVVVTTNMFGDILSDEAAELSGGLGLAGSINAGDRHCMAQAQHGSAPGLAGRDAANPTSLILSAAMLLDWLGRRHARPRFTAAARLIDASVDAVLNDPARRTADLGGPLGTRAFSSELCREVEASATLLPRDHHPDRSTDP